MTATAHPIRRPEGLRRILAAWSIWRRLKQAERLLERSRAARMAGDIDRAERHFNEAGRILAETRTQIDVCSPVCGSD